MSPTKPDRHNRKSPFSALASGLGTAAGITTAIAGGWILYSNLAIDHNVPLSNAINAERQMFLDQHNRKLSYYVDRQASGRPLVLVHSVNAAASAYEMRPLFDHYRTLRPVYAMDLPGFGFSDRPAHSYDPQLYEDALTDLLSSQVGEPSDVVALSLGSEFAARTALRRPELFHSLAMISPTGFGLPTTTRSSQRARAAGSSDSLYVIFSQPLWGRPLYDLIATRRSILFFLQKSFVGPVPAALVDYAYMTAHQPGAQHAPLHFISGKLFTPAVRRTVYELVNTPTLVIYDRDAFTGFDALPDLLEKNHHWHAVRLFPSFGLPQFEKLTETTQELNVFWKDQE
jgi:pimeloyl-ACP methyl ester carboxylesterase